MVSHHVSETWPRKFESCLPSMNDNDLEILATVIKNNHDYAVSNNRSVFEDDPPDDDGVYVYTYYESGQPIYHGMTTSAKQRAKIHQKKAPWSSWVDEVRYRKCSTVRQARNLEIRLQNKVPSLCHSNGRTMTYHGDDWSAIDNKFRINHVKGTCKLPGGICTLTSSNRSSNLWGTA